MAGCCSQPRLSNKWVSAHGTFLLQLLPELPVGVTAFEWLQVPLSGHRTHEELEMTA